MFVMIPCKPRHLVLREHVKRLLDARRQLPRGNQTLMHSLNCLAQNLVTVLREQLNCETWRDYLRLFCIHDALNDRLGEALGWGLQLLATLAL
jgi:hypothetical protein